MLIKLDINSPQFILGGNLFDLKDYEPTAEGFFIYSKETVSPQIANDFVLHYMRESVTIFLKGIYYSARPSMKILPASISPSGNKVLLRLKVEKVPVQTQSDYDNQYQLNDTDLAK